MAINFPSSPAIGQVLNVAPGRSFVFGSNGYWRQAPLKTALPMNYIVNPSMTVSQENGNTGSPASAYNETFFTADQWRPRWNIAAAALGSARWDGPSPAGSKTSYIRVTTPKATLAAVEYALITTWLEGQRFADFQWGTPQAKDVVLRFTGVFGTAGTYAVSVKGTNRSFIATFTVASASVWQVFSIPIPGETSGTWATDITGAIQIDFCMGMGSAYYGVLGWQSVAGLYAVAGQTNGVATVQDWHITEVGLYLDPYKTGVAPPYVIPEHAQELHRCQRYWYPQYALRGGVTGATSVGRAGANHPAPMRAVPAISIVGAPKFWDAFISSLTWTQLNTVCNEFYAEMDVVTVGNWGQGGRGAVQFWQTEAHYVAMNARM